MAIRTGALNLSKLGGIPVPQVGARTVRAVVVDDDPHMLEAICAVLELEDLVTVVGRATNGVEAIHAVVDCNPDLVLMDVSMPVMDGTESAALLREHFPRLRVVLMSGDDAPEVRRRSLASGAEAFIFKMDFPKQFVSVLQRLFPAGEGWRTA